MDLAAGNSVILVKNLLLESQSGHSHGYVCNEVCGLLCFSLIACRFFGQVLSEEICQVYQGDCRPREELEASRAWSWRVV